jgi:hypothetical protein
MVLFSIPAVLNFPFSFLDFPLRENSNSAQLGIARSARISLRPLSSFAGFA